MSDDNDTDSDTDSDTDPEDAADIFDVPSVTEMHNIGTLQMNKNNNIIFTNTKSLLIYR